MSANHVAVLNNSVEAREDGEEPAGKISRKTARMRRYYEILSLNLRNQYLLLLGSGSIGITKIEKTDRR